MKKNDLNILMLEDEQLDAELNIEQLNQLEEYNCIVQLVKDKATYLKALQETIPDVILCDYNIPDYTGIEALNHLKELDRLIPFIFVTGAMIEEVAADAIKAGAWDYVVKDRLFRLPLAIRSALNLKQEKETAALAETKANRLLLAIEQTSAQIVVTDNRGFIEYVNKKFVETTGFSPDSVLGNSAKMLIPENNINDENKEKYQKLIDGQAVKGEILSKRKDGTEYWEYVSITPIHNEHDLLTNYVIVKEDITMRKKMEQDIIDARDKAQQSDTLKNAFLQNMSHEIRTPLNAIVGFSSLLCAPDTTKPEVIKEYTNIINNSSNQLLAIVNDVLTISSIQTGQETLNLKPLDLNSLLDKLYLSVKEVAGNKNIELRHNVSKLKNAIIVSDETKLRKILYNLLNNAIKFTFKGYVEYGYRVEGNSIEFFVHDTGIGIDEKHHEEIFESFRQVDPSIHVEYGGTGLGLAISKSYAHMLNGSISIKSKLGHGTTVYVSIPYKPVSHKTSDKPDNTKLPERRLKVLVAEDEYYNYMLLETIFKRKNYTILHAKNGLEAYNIFLDNSNIDIIIMDIKMPIMDGKKAFEEIRKVNNKVPVLALTAYSLENDRKKLLNMGFSDYLSKPIDHLELYKKINKVIPNETDNT
jgi:PAS domain S-box-containing protein